VSTTGLEHLLAERDAGRTALSKAVEDEAVRPAGREQVGVGKRRSLEHSSDLTMNTVADVGVTCCRLVSSLADLPALTSTCGESRASTPEGRLVWTSTCGQSRASTQVGLRA
jgi:hypothetical protein